MNFLARTEVWIVFLGLAAFLVLYWVIRGAPIGQSAELENDDEAPAKGYRDRVIAGVVVGLLLVAAGAYAALARGILWSLPLFGIGFGTVLTLVAINRRYRHGSPSLRRAVEFSQSALNGALLAGVLIVVNVVAFRYGGQTFDLTRERAFSLSSQSIAALRSLERPVTLTIFFGQGASARPRVDRVRQLVELYHDANPGRIEVRDIDPFRDLGKYEELLKAVPEVALAQGGGLVVEYGEGEGARRAVLRTADLFELPAAPRNEDELNRYQTIFKGEDAVTAALLRLREGRRWKVAFVLGHGESPLSEISPQRAGLGLWRSRLEAIGAEVVEVNLVRQDVPDDVEIAVVAGPRTKFAADEAARLKRFSDRKKPLLVLLGTQDDVGLADFLKGFNLALGKGVVVDPRFNSRGVISFVYAAIESRPRQAIALPLAGRRVLTPNASPITILGSSSPGGKGETPNPAIIVEPVVRTSGESWVETDLKTPRAVFDAGRDVKGPAIVAVAAYEIPASEAGPNVQPIPRLVLISSSPFLENAFLEVEPTNLDLLNNAVGWLRGRPESGGIAPKSHTALTLSADPTLRARLILVPTVLSFILILGLGATTYLARRA